MPVDYIFDNKLEGDSLHYFLHNTPEIIIRDMSR